MGNDKPVVNMMSCAVKFVAVTLLCIFFIFTANHYYQIKDYAASLSRDLNIIIFFDKNAKEGKTIKNEIERIGLVSVKEYVDASEAYLKAVEKNPFLKNIAVPDDVKSIQAYAVVTSITTPDENFLSEMRKGLEGITGVDEIVFDASVFKRYVEVVNLILLYRNVSSIFILATLILFIIRCVLYIWEQKSSRIKFAKNAFTYLTAAAFGFLAIFMMCAYLKYTLSVDEHAVLLIVVFTAVIGIILDSNYAKTP
jgi:cell division transport system permease protein